MSQDIVRVVNLHGTSRENTNNRDLCSLAHLQLPDKEHGKNRVCPVRRAADGRVTIEGIGNDDGIETFAGGRISTVSKPEQRRRSALQDEE